MKSGCPQGSSLGPVIWNLFQNDMAQQVTNSNLTMYADGNLAMVKDSLEEQEKQAMSWYEENYLQANPDKFQTLTIDPTEPGYISEWSRKVGVLTRLRNLVPCSAKLTIYKTSILPHLMYYHIVWHFCKASDRQKIERVQERALRALYRTKTSSTKHF